MVEAVTATGLATGSVGKRGWMMPEEAQGKPGWPETGFAVNCRGGSDK